MGQNFSHSINLHTSAGTSPDTLFRQELSSSSIFFLHAQVVMTVANAVIGVGSIISAAVFQILASRKSSTVCNLLTYVS